MADISPNKRQQQPPPGGKSWYQLPVREVMDILSAGESGLTAEEVTARLDRYGKNELKQAPGKSRISILIGQFKDLMIIILVAAAGISLAVGERTDALVILAIIAANAWMGYSQESKAEDSIRLLQRMVPQRAMVRRNGSPRPVPVPELVPGDILLLEAGDLVPADGRLLTVNALKTDEAALTGESLSTEKAAHALPEPRLNPGDQTNMVFKGTLISNGTGTAVVTATGMRTEIGRIAGMMEIPSMRTPLQARLAVFSRQLAFIVLIICILVFVFGFRRGEPPFLMFLTALSLAVAALPEALPAVITVALAVGARRMAARNALMRNLPAVETLGSVTYICSDKTGTLTRNQMQVERVRPAEGAEDLFRHAMLLNNEVRFAEDGTLLGDSTETALVRYALENGYSRERSLSKLPFRGTVPFDSERMRMSTLHAFEGRWILLVKGAPVKVSEALGADYRDQKEALLDQNRQWASQGLRVLFFACRHFDADPGPLTAELETDLEFLGMAGMIDPPRDEVIEALHECRTAGIKTMMITGDQPLTAAAIAGRLSMAGRELPETRTGAQLNELDAEELAATVKKVFVYARVSPGQKLAIVRALQQSGEFVAMTGDGVNDAPSLKQANIGVAMGITGTAVSREAADMILLDDNFATIVRAVGEGRRIYENIRKFILYVLSCNLAEILTIFLAPLLGLGMPLLPTQILWINLVTDGLPGLALVNEPAEKDLMKRPPRPPGESLFAGGLAGRILLTGAVMAAAALYILSWAADSGYDRRSQQTLVFTVLCFVQLANALSVRSFRRPVLPRMLFGNRGLWASILLTIGLQLLIIYLPVVQPVFKTAPVDRAGMGMVCIVSAVSLLVLELVKYLSAGRRADLAA
ncbi:MAG TPA: cation-translocating P-type ATPase [Sphingobacteriaceae bacterium]